MCINIIRQALKIESNNTPTGGGLTHHICGSMMIVTMTGVIGANELPYVRGKILPSGVAIWMTLKIARMQMLVK